MATTERDFIYKDELYRIIFNNPHPESSVRHIFSWTFILYEKSKIVSGFLKKKTTFEWQNIYEGKCDPPIIHRIACNNVIEKYLKKLQFDNDCKTISNLVKKTNDEWDGIIE